MQDPLVWLADPLVQNILNPNLPHTRNLPPGQDALKVGGVFDIGPCDSSSGIACLALGS